MIKNYGKFNVVFLHKKQQYCLTTAKNGNIIVYMMNKSDKQMKITIEIPQKLLDQFIEDYRELEDCMPSDNDIMEFFSNDIVQVYVNQFEQDGESFLNALG